MFVYDKTKELLQVVLKSERTSQSTHTQYLQLKFMQEGILNHLSYISYLPRSRAGVLNLLRTWDHHINHFLSIRGPQGYEDNLLKHHDSLLRNASKLSLLLQTGSHITQFSLTSSY
jgi:hypothetical protein